MKYSLLFNSILLTVSLLISFNIVAQEKAADKSESPYFMVVSDTIVDNFPLNQTSANVKISGVIADVTVTQTYTNNSSKPLEAIYVFPASTRAAVYYMQMQIGNRIIKARIEEKEKARQQYEEAKETGQTASLLEQQRPNVFQMNVANIMPGDVINVELRYTELLVPIDAVYEFVYPTIVVPRYTTGGGNEWTSIAVEISPPFSMTFEINAGMELKEVTCPSHPELKRHNTGRYAYGSLSSEAGLTDDVVLRYMLSGNEILTGLLLYEGEEENFFLAMLQPPKAVEYDYVPPREYIFVMDVSGSMSGFPIEISKTLLKELISSLRPYDKFNVVFFAGGSSLLSDESLDANAENIDYAINKIDNLYGSGGTELLSALKVAMALPGTEDYARSFVIATDGYVTVEKEAFEYIRNNLSNANFFSFGIGTSVNRYIIEGIAHVGMSEPAIILNQEEAKEKAKKFREYIEFPVMTKISASFDGFDVYDVEPASIPDVLAQRPVLLFGKWHGDPKGKINISGISGTSEINMQLDVDFFEPQESNEALKYLWARHKIQLLDDYANIPYYGDSTAIKEIVELGLKYNLLTNYTSFIAIDTEENDIVTEEPKDSEDNYTDDGMATGIEMAESFVSANINNEAELKAWPNPFVSSTTLEFIIKDIFADNRILIYNSFGQLVKEIEIGNAMIGKNHLQIDFTQESLHAGVYMVIIKADNEITGRTKLTFCK